jgi:hypothetical protein
VELFIHKNVLNKNVAINKHILLKRFDYIVFLRLFHLKFFQHLITCSGGLNISININSTKTLIQRERRYTYWSSLYLDQHGEEDLNLRLFKKKLIFN